MSRKIVPILLVLLILGCSRMGYRHGPTVTVPSKEASFPKLTERNRLLGVQSPERTCYDVTYYQINLTIDPERKYLQGFVDISARAMRNFTRLQIDLAKSMTLNRILYQGQALSYDREEDAVFVQFPAMEAGREFTFRVEYEGQPKEARRPPWDGGFVWETDQQGRPYISVACEGDGASLWWPNKDQILDEPDSIRMTFTVPKALFCVSNGRLEAVSDGLEGFKTYTWAVLNPINNYDVSVQLGNYVLVQDTLQRNGTVETMNHYVLDYHAAVAREHFKQAREVIHFMEKYFGPYQWWKDGYKLVEVSYLGMEHQSAVAYGNSFSNHSDSRGWLNDFYGIVDGLLFHETAHEWWGKSVTAADPAHMWIHEGMAIYCEALYIEDKLGYDVSVDYLLKKRRTIQNRLPIVGPENENYWAFGDAYNKGGWIMHTLRHVVNDDSLWFDILKSFAIQNARGHVRTEDFQKHVEQKSGLDLDYFFKQYFYDRRPPTLEYYQSGQRFYYRWADVISGFRMPLDLNLNGKKVRIFPTEKIQMLEIPAFSVLEIRDWEYLIVKKKSPDLAS